MIFSIIERLCFSGRRFIELGVAYVSLAMSQFPVFLTSSMGISGFWKKRARQFTVSFFKGWWEFTKWINCERKLSTAGLLLRVLKSLL